MGVLTADRELESTHIRPFRLTRDLPALADLVEVCFEDDLRRTGSPIVAEIRQMATLGSGLYLLALLGSPYRGIVWEEGGRLLGNVTITREHGRVWSLSNVAVVPEARGRRIGSALLDQAIQRLRDWGASEIILQVRPENQVAVGMYTRRGFVSYDRVEELLLPASDWPALTVSADSTVVRRSMRSDGAEIEQVLHSAMSPLALRVERSPMLAWRQGVLAEVRRACALVFKAQERIERVAVIDGRVLGLGWATARFLGTSHELGLLASPDGQGVVEYPLLAGLFSALRRYPRLDARAVISTRQKGALEAMNTVGFQTMRVLDRMVLVVTPPHGARRSGKESR